MDAKRFRFFAGPRLRAFRAFLARPFEPTRSTVLAYVDLLVLDVAT